MQAYNNYKVSDEPYLTAGRDKWYMYSFRGETRFYKKPLMYVDSDIVKFLGVTPFKYSDHWTIEHPNPLRPNKNYDNPFSKIDKGDGFGFDGPIKKVTIPKSLLVVKSKYKTKRTDDEAAYERHGGSKLERTNFKPAYKDSPSYKQMIKKNLIDGMFDCCYCGTTLTKDNYAREHVVPVSRGGSNGLNNLLPCCYDCNYEKGNLLLHSYIQFLCLKQSDIKPGTPEYDKLQIKIINANEIAKSMAKNP